MCRVDSIKQKTYFCEIPFVAHCKTSMTSTSLALHTTLQVSMLHTLSSNILCVSDGKGTSVAFGAVAGAENTDDMAGPPGDSMSDSEASSDSHAEDTDYSSSSSDDGSSSSDDSSSSSSRCHI